MGPMAGRQPLAGPPRVQRTHSLCYLDPGRA